MNNNSPLISIICCLYNTPSNLFNKSLQSAICQTYSNFEFIIMNDGSDKYLEENIKLIEDLKDKRFKLYHKEHNGKSNTLNEAIKLCNGKYIAIWDSDDTFNENRLTYQLTILENTDIECLSNALVDDLGIISPSYDKSQYINKYNIHYLAFHPCQMFNKEKVLNKVPYLFENCYDSMEDTIFNHIMFYHGVKMYYDNKILGNYCIVNPDCAHKNNLYGYLKFCTENLRYKFIDNYLNKVTFNNKITIILLVNELWKDELEKTIFNIRITSNNYVNIIVGLYNVDNTINKDKLIELYNVRFIEDDSYINVLKKSLNFVETDLLFIISNPIRFTTEMWDWRISRFIDNEISNIDDIILQPYMFDMEKINSNYYLNSRGKYEKHNIQYGERLTLLTESLTEKIEEAPIKSEYILYSQIPLLNDSLCYIISKKTLIDLLQYINFGPDLTNVMMSLFHYNNKHRIYLYYDIELSLNQIEYNSKNSFIYYSNYVYIVNTFFNESKHIYKHILSSIGLTDITIKTYTNIYNKIKQNDLKINLDDFYKNINCKEPWIL